MPSWRIVHPTEEDKQKAAFLTEYRALCEKHGLFVIHVIREEYCPFALAILNEEDGTKVFDLAINEMLLESLVRIRKE
jgi:hypothetical protein